jgi:chromosome segregation ATPase
MNLTPYSIYITVRKSFSKNKVLPKSDRASYRGELSCDRQVELVQQIEDLEFKLKQAENANLTLKHNFEEAIEDSEASYKEINLLKAKISEYEREATLKQVSVTNETLIKQLENDNSELLEQVKMVEKESKDLKKVVNEKEKQVHNLNREIKNESENFKQLKAKFDDITAAVNREKKQQERKLKKQERKDFLNNLKTESMNLYFECEKCDVKLETRTQLTYHVRSLHMKSVQSQTDDEEVEEKLVQTDPREFTIDKNVQTEDEKSSETFVKYPCNYCGTKIANKYHLYEHKGKCRGTLNFCTEPGLPMLPFFSPRFTRPQNLPNPYRF